MWNVIGEQLEVNYDMSLEYYEAYENNRKFSQVLQLWIDNRTCEVSWRKIITVVKEPAIENKHITDNI